MMYTLNYNKSLENVHIFSVKSECTTGKGVKAITHKFTNISVKSGLIPSEHLQEREQFMDMFCNLKAKQELKLTGVL